VGWGKDNTSFFCGAFCEAKYKFRRRPKRGRGGRGVWGEFRRARAEAKPRRPARSEQSPAKKFSFPFRRKNRARAKLGKAEKTFLLAGERQRAAAGRSVQNSQSGFSSKKVRILSKRYRQFTKFGFWAIVASPSLRSGSASARILKGNLKSKNNFCPLKWKFGLPKANINLKNLLTNLFSFAEGERQSDNFKYFDCLIIKTL